MYKSSPTDVPNVTTVTIVPKITKDDSSVPKSCLLYQQNDTNTVYQLVYQT